MRCVVVLFMLDAIGCWLSYFSIGQGMKRRKEWIEIGMNRTPLNEEHQRAMLLNGYAPRHHSIRITAVLIKCTQKGASEEWASARNDIRCTITIITFVFSEIVAVQFLWFQYKNKHWPMSSNGAVAFGFSHCHYCSGCSCCWLLFNVCPFVWCIQSI